jgi:hypothetical protein
MAIIRTVLAAFAVIGAIGSADAQEFSSEELARRTIERRAVEAVIWGLPAVNYHLMLQEMLTKTASKANEVIYWGRPLDWHNQTLTPNPDTPGGIRLRARPSRPAQAGAGIELPDGLQRLPERRR